MTPLAFVGREVELAGLVDWLRRPEDPGIALITGPQGHGKTALVLQLTEHWRKLKLRGSAGVQATQEQAKRGTVPDELLWLPAGELRDGQRGPVANCRLYSKLLGVDAGRVEVQRSPPAKEEGAQQQQLRATSCLLIIDDWPSDEELPALRLGRHWKVLLTAQRRPPTAGQAVLELALGGLAHEQMMKLFIELTRTHSSSTGTLDLYPFLTRMAKALAGNPLEAGLACCVWDDIIREPSESHSEDLAELINSLEQSHSHKTRLEKLLRAIKKRIPNPAWMLLRHLIALKRSGEVTVWCAANPDLHPVDLHVEGLSTASFVEVCAVVRQRLEVLRTWGLLSHEGSTATYGIPPALNGVLLDLFPQSI